MFFSGNLYRMNTVFKFHYQVWILLSLALGPFLKWLMENPWVRWHLWKKITGGALAVILIGVAAMYPLLSFYIPFKWLVSGFGDHGRRNIL